MIRWTAAVALLVAVLASCDSSTAPELHYGSVAGVYTAILRDGDPLPVLDRDGRCDILDRAVRLRADSVWLVEELNDAEGCLSWEEFGTAGTYEFTRDSIFTDQGWSGGYSGEVAMNDSEWIAFGFTFREERASGTWVYQRVDCDEQTLLDCD